MNGNGQSKWFDDYYTDEEEEKSVAEHGDITATPNDFNIMTLYDFMESGIVRIPSFQRNYVWDIKRASKLIESLILGLPVPQIFLYEQKRDQFLVIDGQQRMMSIYYFIKQRFPRKENRVKLRAIFDENGKIPDAILGDDNYFRDFSLRLPGMLPHSHSSHSKFSGLKYSTLEEYQTQFKLRPIRHVVIKQNNTSDDNTAIFEIFNRLNSGGMNICQQEIRASMYASKFYDMLSHINANKVWRNQVLQTPTPDLRMKDMEIILRGFAMLIDGRNYTPTMVKFLNQFSMKCKKQSEDKNQYLRKLFLSFMEACSQLPDNTFINKKNNRFNIALYEAVFTVTCEKAFSENRFVQGTMNTEQINLLENDSAFVDATQKDAAGTANVKTRLEKAREIVCPL